VQAAHARSARRDALSSETLVRAYTHTNTHTHTRWDERTPERGAGDVALSLGAPESGSCWKCVPKSMWSPHVFRKCAKHSSGSVPMAAKSFSMRSVAEARVMAKPRQKSRLRFRVLLVKALASTIDTRRIDE
jgi:hypothetical protein